MSELAKDIVRESQIIFMIFLKKILEFFSHHQIVGLRAIFLLMPLLNYYSAEKQDGKKDLVRLISPSSFKIVFILLVETIVVSR